MIFKKWGLEIFRAVSIEQLHDLRVYRLLRFFFQIRYRYLLIQNADTEIRCYDTYEPLRAEIITASPISAAHAAARSISL